MTQMLTKKTKPQSDKIETLHPEKGNGTLIDRVQNTGNIEMGRNNYRQASHFFQSIY